MYGYDELDMVQDVVKEAVSKPNKLRELVIYLNRIDQLDEFMDMLGISTNNSVFKAGKILVVGDSEVGKNTLLEVAKEFGISEERFEFCLDYHAAKTYNFKKLQFNKHYSLVLIGPMPHSSHEKGDFSSVLRSISQTLGYPPVVGLGLPCLKITKNNFRKALEDAFDKGLLSDCYDG